MALFSIVSAIAFPLFVGLLDDQKLTNEADLLASVLRKARSDAVLHGKPIVVKFYVNDNSYKVFYTQIPGMEDIRYRLQKDITYVGTTTFPPGIDKNPYCGFTSTGTPSGSGTVTLINNRGTKRYIIVNPVAGRIRISDQPPAHWE